MGPGFWASVLPRRPCQGLREICNRTAAEVIHVHTQACMLLIFWHLIFLLWDFLFFFELRYRTLVFLHVRSLSCRLLETLGCPAFLPPRSMTLTFELHIFVSHSSNIRFMCVEAQLRDQPLRTARLELFVQSAQRPIDMEDWWNLLEQS